MESHIVNMQSKLGIDLRCRSKSIYIVELRQYKCSKDFADIREDEIVYAGFDPHKGGYFISHERWSDAVIGIKLFHEHFEDDEPFFHPEMLQCLSMNGMLDYYFQTKRKYYK